MVELSVDVGVVGPRSRTVASAVSTASRVQARPVSLDEEA